MNPAFKMELVRFIQVVEKELMEEKSKEIKTHLENFISNKVFQETTYTRLQNGKPSRAFGNSKNAKEYFHLG